MKMLAVQLVWAGVGAVLLLVVPIQAPAAHVGRWPSLLLGAAAGGALFVALARPRRLARPRSALLALASTAAATEEIVWRWGAIAGTLPLVGLGGALAAGTVGFAFGHVPICAPRRLPPYLLLGATFGVVFLATGRLGAAIAAHGAYNALAVSQEPS